MKPEELNLFLNKNVCIRFLSGERQFRYFGRLVSVGDTHIILESDRHGRSAVPLSDIISIFEEKNRREDVHAFY